MNPTSEELYKLCEVIDSTKLKSFLACPRRYFYEYVLRWEPTGSSLHLNFGEAWHSAMESLLSSLQEKGSYEAGVADAAQAFLTTYRRYFDESEDSANAPKDPDNAIAALAEYAIRYSSTDAKWK